MTFIQEMLTKKVEQLERDSKWLQQVREWVTERRRMLDNFGPEITTIYGDFMKVDYFEDLEDILGPNQAKK